MLIYKQLFYNYNHVNMHFHLYLTYSQVRWYWADTVYYLLYNSPNYSNPLVGHFAEIKIYDRDTKTLWFGHFFYKNTLTCSMIPKQSDNNNVLNSPLVRMFKLME
jgi:hypothetical protein